ncbi:unnamed protein product, partial [Anisakis simplex]|uniref:Uncharacterized protein n=1 Tax=Anisakis simplex TaxID=6269 RepID=A0A0M3JAU6_ANISI
MDSGSRLIAITNKQRDEHERFVQSVKAEKVQVERIIENRDRVHKNRVQQLEGQLNTLREQLAEERRRHRDMADRIMINDMSKMSTAASAAAATWGSLGSYSTAPVSRTGGLMAMTGTQLPPQKLDSSFDSLFG